MAGCVSPVIRVYTGKGVSLRSARSVIATLKQHVSVEVRMPNSHPISMLLTTIYYISHNKRSSSYITSIAIKKTLVRMADGTEQFMGHLAFTLHKKHHIYRFSSECGAALHCSMSILVRSWQHRHPYLEERYDFSQNRETLLWRRFRRSRNWQFVEESGCPGRCC